MSLMSKIAKSVRASSTYGHIKSQKTINVLLITNCNSDNIGDQFIEACDVALIKTAVANLDLNPDRVAIDSHDLSTIPSTYCKTGNRSLLATAYRRIKACTFVLFGGAPMFNYAYQPFYLKTATYLEIAKELGKPVIFSAVGIDAYDEDDERCQLLRRALHNGTVRQVTTRDGIEHLRRYAAPPQEQNAGSDPAFPISLVSDPAVYADLVFKNFRTGKSRVRDKTKHIGVFVFRAGGFNDNGIKFTRAKQCQFWKDLCVQLESRGYDYELITSGHFADEAMIKYLVDNKFVSASKCVRTLNTPEELAAHLSSYDGVISCRLHPSIISYAFDIPSVSLIWNAKVPEFYRNVKHPERALDVSTLFTEGSVSSLPLVEALERAMNEGICKDPAYVRSVYTTLLDGFAACIGREKSTYEPFSNKEIAAHLPGYPGTSDHAKALKIQRKLTRCYLNYNEAVAPSGALKFTSAKDAAIKGADTEFRIIYNSGRKSGSCRITFNQSNFNLNKLKSGSIELTPSQASTVLEKSPFSYIGSQFAGWKVRVKEAGQWYWILEDNSLAEKTTYDANRGVRIRIFREEEQLPDLQPHVIELAVAEACWANTTKGTGTAVRQPRQ